MIPVIPGYIELIALAGSFGIAFFVWVILSSAAGRSGLPPVTQQAVRAGVAVFLGAWLGTALVLAPSPSSLIGRDRFYLTPLIPALGIVAPVIVLVALRFSPALRRVFSFASIPAIIGVQLYRTIGVLFLILLTLGQVPAHFALPAGWGDIVVGLTAPLVALALIRGVPGARTLAISWNVFGLLDLIVAVGMGTGFLAPFLAPELGARVPPVAAMGVFPLVLIPTFAVPVSVLLHGFALARLRREIRLGSRLVPKAAN